MTTPFSRIEHVDLADRTCDILRKRILTREFATHTQIPVETIAAQLGVSRTPVLDALKQLEGEGLVEILPRRGCYVKALTVEDVREIFEAREAVELFCTRVIIGQKEGKTVAKRLEPLIAEMQRQVRGEEFLDYEAFTVADRGFHDLIVSAAANKRLNRIYANLNIHMHVMRVHLYQDIETPSRVMSDHGRIWQSFFNEDGPAAEEATIEHLRGISLKMLDHLTRNGGSL